MTSEPSSPVIHSPRQIASPLADCETADGELLERFVCARDQAAFAVLVQRHGPMVLGVCRRVLGQTQDAEDAFQATFMVLVRRASSLERPELLGNWLYGVARRLSLKARQSAKRRNAREAKLQPKTPPDALADISARELQNVLDEELGRLPTGLAYTGTVTTDFGGWQYHTVVFRSP